MPTAREHTTYTTVSGRNTPAMHSQTHQPRPQYFISRVNGPLVPLIPADELPFNIRLQNVPRTLPFDQTYGMQYIGTVPSTGLTYKLEDDSVALQRSVSQPSAPLANGSSPAPVCSQSDKATPMKQFLAPDAAVRQTLAQKALATYPTATATLQPPPPKRPVSAHETATSWRSSKPVISKPSADKAQALIDAVISSDSGAAEAARIGYIPRSTSPPPSGVLPDQEKKEYCTYWIRRGECDYMQQGCLFKHEMPDLVTLKKIGIRSVPRWWTERNSATKFAGSGGDGKASVGPIVKSSVWLDRKSKDESESEDEDDDDGSAGLRSGAEKVGVTTTTTVKKLTEPVKGWAASTSKKVSPSMSGPTNRASVIADDVSPAPDDHRKYSTTSDLIDFAPLSFTPSPTPSPSLTSSASVTSSPGSSHDAPLTPPTPALDDTSEARHSASLSSTATTSTTRVFVPKGESPAHHISAAKKRESASRQQTRREAALFEQQRQKQKASTAKDVSMASQHAAPLHHVHGQGAKRGAGASNGCRVRRPANPVTALVEGSVGRK